MEEKMIERIDAYLLNRMTQNERRKFEEDLKTDDALRKQYHFMTTMKTSVASWTEMKRKMEAWDEAARKQELSDLRSKQHMSKVRRLWIGGAVAAAVVAIAIVLPMAIPTADGSKDSFIAEETARGNDVTFDDATANVADYQVSQDVDYTYITTACAPAQLKEIKESINRQDYEDAISELDEAIRTAKTQAGIDSLSWLKVELLLKTDKEQEARTILENLKHNSQTLSQKADSLLKVLDH